MGKRLLLMSLRSPYLDDAKVYPTLGILYLKSAAEKQISDLEIDLMDDYDLNDPSLFDPYDFVGLSVMTPQREEANRVLTRIKDLDPKKKVIIGGPHAQFYFDEVQRQPWDHIVLRDGQRSLVRILQGDERRIYSDILNKQEWKDQPNPDRTSDIARKFLAQYNYTLQGKRAGTMLTATGCPELCKFCEDSQTQVRWRSVETLAQEMDDLLSLGYQGVYLFDDIFSIAMHQIKPILVELKKRDLVFRCNGQARYFTKWGEDFAKLLAEHGCAEIAFGHETGSQKILDNIQKRTTVQQNYDSVIYAKKYGVKVKSFILLGLPGEDMETLAETERFVATAGMDDFQCCVFMPFKGTKIRESIDRGETIDLKIEAKGADGEITGAYGIKGGESSYEVRTGALSSKDLEDFRNYLVTTYKPKSHAKKWQEDKFFDIGKDTHSI